MKEKDIEINEKMEYYLKKYGLIGKLDELTKKSIQNSIYGRTDIRIVSKIIFILSEAEKWAKKIKIFNVEDLELVKEL